MEDRSCGECGQDPAPHVDVSVTLKSQLLEVITLDSAGGAASPYDRTHIALSGAQEDDPDTQPGICLVALFEQVASCLDLRGPGCDSEVQKYR